MDPLLFVAAWYAAGCIGSAITLEFVFRRGRDYPLDITVGDLVIGSFVAILGPINLVVGLVFLASWLFARTFNTDKVIFPARRAH